MILLTFLFNFGLNTSWQKTFEVRTWETWQHWNLGSPNSAFCLIEWSGWWLSTENHYWRPHVNCPQGDRVGTRKLSTHIMSHYDNTHQKLSRTEYILDCKFSKRKSNKYKHGITITETADIVILRKKIHVPPIVVHVFWDPPVKRFTLWVHRYQILISCCRRARISNTQNRQSTHCFCFDILTKANTRDRKYYQSHTKLSSPYSSDHHDLLQEQLWQDQRHLLYSSRPSSTLQLFPWQAIVTRYIQKFSFVPQLRLFWLLSSNISGGDTTLHCWSRCSMQDTQ